jgi:hypothetical protein
MPKQTIGGERRMDGDRGTGNISIADGKRWHKTRLAESPDPDGALRSYFEWLGLPLHDTSERPLERPKRQSLPLILISQLPRSGGSLFSQLCDGHKQLFVNPSELRIGYPNKVAWPQLDPRASPERLFAMLFHFRLGGFAAKGYHKKGKAQQTYGRLSFDYSPIEHYRAFVDLLDPRPNTRATLDSYFGALFHAWPSGRVPDPRYVVGFVPKMAMRADSIASFFADYPDGRLVTIMRNPADWFVSRRAHTRGGVERYADLEQEMAAWNTMAAAALKYRRLYGDKVLLVSFRDLVSDREATMRRFAANCGIEFDAALINQTFAGQPIAPNTNFDDPQERLEEAVLSRASHLNEEERQKTLILTRDSRARLEEEGCLC